MHIHDHQGAQGGPLQLGELPPHKAHNIVQLAGALVCHCLDPTCTGVQMLLAATELFAELFQLQVGRTADVRECCKDRECYSKVKLKLPMQSTSVRPKMQQDAAAHQEYHS